MNTFLNDYEERSFETAQDLCDFLAERETKDEWEDVYLPETAVIGVPDAPIVASQIVSGIENYAGTEEGLKESMAELGLLLSYPSDKGSKTVPMRYTAPRSVFDRAGLSGPVLTKTGNGYLAPETKAEWLTTCLKLGANADTQGKILMRDGKVSTFRSAKYVPVRGSRLLQVITNQLMYEYGSYKMEQSVVNHEYTAAVFAFGDEAAKDDLLRTLGDLGILCSEVSPSLLFVTSDVASSAAKVIPSITVDKVTMAFGDPIVMKHMGECTIEKWEELMSQVGSLKAQTFDKLVEMSKILVKHPGGCLRGLADKIELPRAASRNRAEQFEAEFPITCTALDIYKCLYEIAMSSKETGEHLSVDELENIARVLNMNMGTYDCNYP